MEMAEKMAKFGPKTLFLAISGPRGPRGMVKVEQMVDHSKTCLMRNSPEKCTQWCGNGPKVAHLVPKSLFLAIRGSRRPRWLAKVDQMVDHSGRHGGLP